MILDPDGLRRRYIEQLEAENARLRMELDEALKVHRDWLAEAWQRGQRQAGANAGMVRTTDVKAMSADKVRDRYIRPLADMWRENTNG